jgi:hypothetical protein
MIKDHTRIWLLRPGFTLEQFGKLPSWLDETDERPAAEQFGERWLPIEGSGGWKVRGLHGDGQVYEPPGAIHFPRELVMLFDDDLVAIVQSDRSFEVIRIERHVRYPERYKDQLANKERTHDA